MKRRLCNEEAKDEGSKSRGNREDMTKSRSNVQTTHIMPLDSLVSKTKSGMTGSAAFGENFGFTCRFYTLVSQDTDEVAFSEKRKRFLVDQGYTYKVVSDLKELIPSEDAAKLAYYSRKEQVALLSHLLDHQDEMGDEVELN
ncbi:hypothetical protein BCR33DRAFT_783226 [Rhizoclosmatium globosum]|uniref:ERCC3/RAD25/XPB helicase C-terminal domain-containing protein n=1 Tax=Rhizoclosmatium globosum TaxID=329046 RepID=A0A1Y2CI58_9FUNG|nr:hypothetical protein BCR33DRAFT_783226 [Rhizoclosmatium globosum]|eukprot:ORY46741.1 hypothetical protein BCR33DRAFT_783226 [Rhizoclosmatium globosum]